MSHVKALQVACANTERNSVALVMEDDADFGPMEHWPLPLTAMLRTLPEDWAIVNAGTHFACLGPVFRCVVQNMQLRAYALQLRAT